MSRTGAQWDDWEQGKTHKTRVVKKLERIQGLRALLETWETREAENGHQDSDHSYVLELRAKLRAAQNQYEAMA